MREDAVPTGSPSSWSTEQYFRGTGAESVTADLVPVVTEQLLYGSGVSFILQKRNPVFQYFVGPSVDGAK